MLSSITPLGERSRHMSWRRTASAYLVGSTLAGALLGALLGAAGSLVPEPVRGAPATLVALGVLAVVGVVVDRRSRGDGVPSWRRQVDREWIGRYRGWVTGLGFGLQLGLGVVTIVTSTSIYAVLVAEALTGRWWAGALIGATFGLVRALPLLTVRRVEHPEALHRTFAGIERWAAPADRLAGFALIAAAATCVAVAGTM